MKKKVLLAILSLTCVIMVHAQEEIHICKGSGVTCEAKVTNPDGSSVETKSEKDKDSTAVIIKK